MGRRLGLRCELMEPMAWLLHFLSILAAAITSLFVARDALNFGIIKTLLMITLVVAVAVFTVAWKIRRES
jgi:hypothetical protein